MASTARLGVSAYRVGSTAGVGESAGRAMEEGWEEGSNCASLAVDFSLQNLELESEPTSR